MNITKICFVIDNYKKKGFTEVERDPIFLLLKKLPSNIFEKFTLILTTNYDKKEETNFGQYLIDNYKIEAHFLNLSQYKQWDHNHLQKAKALYEFFSETSHSFDVILFPDSQGIAYLCLKCKKSMTCFDNSMIGLLCHEPTQWKQETTIEPMGYINLFFSDYERVCASYADFIISPSQELINWMNQKSWKLPERLYVLPDMNNSDRNWSDLSETKTIRTDSITDIICYGSLLAHGGISYVIEAFSLMPKDNFKNKRILILTSDPINENPSAISQINHLKTEKINIHILQVKNPSDLTSHIQEKGQFWIIPSGNNILSPQIHLCLNRKIPFICSEQGGQSELIDIRDHESCLFAPRSQAIAKKLTEIFEKPTISIPRPSKSLRFAEENCIKLLENLGNEARKLNQKNIPCENPLVSIIIPTYNRPWILQEAVNSALNQTYSNIEIIIVDDGSPDPDVLVIIEQLQQKFPQIHVIHQENKGPGAARNTGVCLSQGEFLIFLDDDDLLFPEYVKICLNIAFKEDADCVIPSPQVLIPHSNPRFWLFTGGGYPGDFMPSSILENTYGTSCILIKRRICIEHPYPEVYRQGWEDWSFLLDIHLSGYKLAIFPRALFNYRVSDSGVNKITSDIGNYRVIFRTLEKHGLQNIGLFAELFRFCETKNHANKPIWLKIISHFLNLIDYRRLLRISNLGLKKILYFPFFHHK